ncbi:unnamed protein product [Rotaria sp. Silwood1]|nr:unnamed protein product [Rotaria sp. Silwood1]
MSRQYSNHSFIPSHHHDHVSSDNSSTRRFRPSIQNNFSYFEYPSQRHTFESNREINTSTLSLNRIQNVATTSAYVPLYHFENHNEIILRSSYHSNHTKRQRRPSTVGISNSQTNQHHHERKRSRNDENSRQQQNRSFINHGSTQIQQTNPTTHYIPSFSRSFHYGSHNHSPQHRNGMTFALTSYRAPFFHPTSMATYVHQRPSPSFLLTNSFRHVVDTHITSFDLIAYIWMSPSHDIFSLPTSFSIQFGEFFDLFIPDETPMVGLTENELERIPTMIYEKICKNIKDDDKCAICLNEYITDEKLKRLRCKHYFHSECIDPWLMTSTRCPICRGEQTN